MRQATLGNLGGSAASQLADSLKNDLVDQFDWLELQFNQVQQQEQVTHTIGPPTLLPDYDPDWDQ